MNFLEAAIDETITSKLLYSAIIEYKSLVFFFFFDIFSLFWEILGFIIFAKLRKNKF